MKTILILTFVIWASINFSQKVFLTGVGSAFEMSNTDTYCNRDWMASEEVMDSLKRVIENLDRKLNSLPQDAIFNDSISLVLLYSYEYIVRNDPWGPSRDQLCIDADKYGTPVTLQKSDKGIVNDTKSFDNTFVVITDTYYYLGNSEIWTTHKKYYMRLEKFQRK